MGCRNTFKKTISKILLSALKTKIAAEASLLHTHFS